MDSNSIDPVQIDIHLECEAVDVSRSVLARPLGNNRFQILSENENPEEEKWQFSTGENVLCCMKELSDGPALVAVEKY